MKKVLLSGLIICILLVSSIAYAEEPEPIIGPPLYINLGDANDDYVVDISDAMIILRVSLGLTSFEPYSQEFYNSDINFNNIIDFEDALWTLRYAVSNIH